MSAETKLTTLLQAAERWEKRAERIRDSSKDESVVTEAIGWLNAITYMRAIVGTDAWGQEIEKLTRERDEALRTVAELRGTPDERTAGIRRRARALIERDPVGALANVIGALAEDEARELRDHVELVETQLAELRDAASTACVVCGGSGVRRSRCSMCHDSTWDHECDDAEVPCEACAKVRAVLAALPADIAAERDRRIQDETAAMYRENARLAEAERERLEAEVARLTGCRRCGDTITPGTMNAAAVLFTADGVECGTCADEAGGSGNEALALLLEMRKPAIAVWSALAEVLTPGHDGDEESGACDEDCEACAIEAARSAAEALHDVVVQNERRLVRSEPE